MQIRDITIDDVRKKKAWRVCDWDAWLVGPDQPMENMTIEPLITYGPVDALVYPGLAVHLAPGGEPGEGKRRRDCIHAPENPADLAPSQIPVLHALLMIKVVSDVGWDYCHYTEMGWRQLGLVPDPLAPLLTEYIWIPVEDDAEFSIEVDDGVTIGDLHRRGFDAWVSLL